MLRNLIYIAAFTLASSELSATNALSFPDNFEHRPENKDDVWLRYLFGVKINLKDYAGDQTDFNDFNKKYKDLQDACKVYPDPKDIFGKQEERQMSPRLAYNPGGETSIKTQACGRAVGDAMRALFTNQNIAQNIYKNMGSNLFQNFTALRADLVANRSTTGVTSGPEESQEMAKKRQTMAESMGQREEERMAVLQQQKQALKAAGEELSKQQGMTQQPAAIPGKLVTELEGKQSKSRQTIRVKAPRIPTPGQKLGKGNESK